MHPNIQRSHVTGTAEKNNHCCLDLPQAFRCLTNEKLSLFAREVMAPDFASNVCYTEPINLWMVGLRKCVFVAILCTVTQAVGVTT